MVLADEPVAVAYLFGSRARGEAGPLSDVDVAVLAPAVEPRDRLDLRLRIGGLLADVLQFPAVDVIVLDEAPLVLAGEVVRDGVVIHSVDEDLRSEYESRIFREYVDFSLLGDAFAREALLDRIGEETRHLRRLATLPDLDLDLTAAVKYRFVVAIEASIDAARHLALSTGLRGATDFADAFTVLGDAEVLDRDLVERLGALARFRNSLAHGYAVVDDTRVVEILRTRLGDLDDFRRQVAAAASTS